MWTVTESGMDERKEGWEKVKEDGRSDGKKKRKTGRQRERATEILEVIKK